MADTNLTRSLPAPKTFAPSREDVLSTLAFFFGDPAVPEKLRDYSEHHAMTYHFPDAYYGQNTKIRETLNNLILKAPQEWHTQVALPFVRIEGTTVEWDEMRFDVRLLQRVPYEGVSRMQTSLRRRHRDRVVRRGIGMTIESDFYATEAGRQHFTDQLTSIRYFRYDLSKGLRPRRSVRTAMAHEIQMYAIVQKEGLGLDKAIEDCKYRMSRYSVTPNMLIVAPQLLLYLATAPEEKMRYIEGGERAVTRFEEGAAGYEARAYRGLGVFASMPYEVSDDQDSVQMLQRSTQVGEFYRMHPPPVWDKTKKLPQTYADILVYDEEADKHQHIRFRTALHAACPEADVTGQHNNMLLALLLKEGRKTIIGDVTYQAAAFRTELSREYGVAPGDPALLLMPGAPAAAAQAALQSLAGGGGEKVNKRTLIAAVEAGAWVPFCIVIARPFIEHLMMSAIMTVSGRDTGATLFGPADMQISANTSVKTIEGHYTCHTKSVITKPQNVYVMRDIMCTGYVAGGNCQFFGMNKTNSFEAQDEQETAAGGDTQEEVDTANERAVQVRSARYVAIRDAINKRLSFHDDASGEYASMLAFLCPYSEVTGGHRDQVISLSERLLPWEVTRHTVNTSKDYFPGGKEGFDLYKDKIGLNQLHFGEDVRAVENMEFISQGSVNNAMCFVGPHRRYNPFSSNFFELIPGQGHFGPDAIPGDARWRRGESVSLRAARNSMVGIEVATHSQLALRAADVPA